MNEFGDPGQQPMDNPRRRWGWSDTPPTRWPHELLQSRQPQPSGRASWYATSPDDRSLQMRVVWNGWSDEVAGARIWDTYPQTDSAARPAGRLAAEVRQAFAQFLADEITAAVWPVPSAGPTFPASHAEMLALAEELLDPRILAAKLVAATVRVAAVHAGIPSPVAQVMGQAAGDLFLSLVSPDPDARKVQAVQYVDLTVSAENGSVLDSPALPQIADGEIADVLDSLLGPDDLTPAAPNRPAPQPDDLTPAAPNRPAPQPDDLTPAAPNRPAPQPDEQGPAEPKPPPREPDELRPAEPKPAPPVDDGFGFGP
jgi:hypothetical protein